MTTPVSSATPAVPPALPEIEAAAIALEGLTRLTPVAPWDDPVLRPRIGDRTRVLLKLELFQHTGTFKVRGALTVMRSLDPETLARGVTAVVARELAKEHGLKLHLVGSSPLPEIPEAYRNLNDDELKEVRGIVMKEALASGEKPADAWGRFEKALEIEPNNTFIKQNYELFKEINDRTSRPDTQ